MTSNFQPARLDVDTNILDRNLHFVSNPEEDDLNSLFPGITAPKEPLMNLVSGPDYPSIMVTPLPGICVKTKNESGEKFFVNVCKLNEIPPPPPITEKELEDMIAREDYTNLWRVPMSIGAPRKETDKSGVSCWAADVAINKKWFEESMMTSATFTTFVITIAIEGLGDKHPTEARLDRQNWTVLKNKKFLGDKPPQHCIQQRASSGIEEVEKKNTTNFQDKKKNQDKVLIKEVEEGVELNKQKIVPLKSRESERNVSKERTPQFKIVKDPVDDPSFLVATVELVGVRSGKEVSLDVGEDRLVVEARRAGYLLDIFLPYRMNNEDTGAQFSTITQELTITIPILK